MDLRILPSSVLDLYNPVRFCQYKDPLQESKTGSYFRGYLAKGQCFH